MFRLLNAQLKTAQQQRATEAMSVVSRNPFDLLGDDGDSPSPAQTKSTSAAGATAATKKAPNANEGTTQRNVPGAAPRGGAARGGRYPSRGGPRTVYRDDKGPRNTAPDEADPNNFDGERVAPPKRAHQGPDKHTRGDRGNLTTGGHKSRGGGRGAKTPAFGGERRQFERRSGTLPDSQKKVEQGWGSNEGVAELSAEVQGENDAQAEEAAPQTPTGDEPVEANEVAAEETLPEPEDLQKSYDQFLAERTEAALAAGFGKKEVRQVTSDTLEGKAFVREGINDFFSGKEKITTKQKAASKKEKVFIEVDGQFAIPAGRPTRGTGERGRGGRGGRGGDRGGRGGDRGGRGGDRGGRGRGAPRGGRGFGARGGAPIDGSDEKAFPALGA